MPATVLLALTALFTLLCAVALALCVQQWRGRGERRWEAAVVTVAFGCMAVLMYLMHFDSPSGCPLDHGQCSGRRC